MNLQELRDLIIVIVGSLGVLFLLVLLIASVVLALAARKLLVTVNRLLTDEVRPLVQSARGTVDNVRGTASFVSEKAVSPFIRAYSLYTGARRFAGVLTRRRR